MARGLHQGPVTRTRRAVISIQRQGPSGPIRVCRVIQPRPFTVRGNSRGTGSSCSCRLPARRFSWAFPGTAGSSRPKAVGVDPLCLSPSGLSASKPVQPALTSQTRQAAAVATSLGAQPAPGVWPAGMSTFIRSAGRAAFERIGSPLVRPVACQVSAWAVSCQRSLFRVQQVLPGPSPSGVR